MRFSDNIAGDIADPLRNAARVPVIALSRKVMRVIPPRTERKRERERERERERRS